MKWLIFILSMFCVTTSYGNPYSFNYSGRLAGVSGDPQIGPVDLQVKFFRAATGGSEIGPTLPFLGTRLAQGVFQINIALTSSERAEVFDADKNVFIEVTDATNSRTYPRQKMGATAFALRVPVDSSTLSWNSDGELTVSESASVTKLDGTKVDASGATNGQVLTWNNSSKTWEPTSIGPGNITNESITKDQIAPDSIGVSELDDSLCADTQILKKSGGVWSCATDSGAGTSISDGGDTYAQNIDIGPTDAFDLNFLTDSAGAGGVRMTIDATGNIGMGTTSPTSKLHLSGAVASGSNYTTHTLDQYSANSSQWAGVVTRKSHQNAVGHTSTIDQEVLGQFGFMGNTGTDFAQGAYIYGIQDGAAGATFIPTDIRFDTSDGTAGAQQRMTIKSDGKIGIGTTVPISQLHVKGSGAGGVGTIERTGTNGGGAASALDIVTDSKTIGDGSLVNYTALDSADNPTVYSRIKLGIEDPTNGSEDGSIAFNTVYNGAYADRMTISAAGNVGIGSTAPVAALDVAGTSGIRAHQICDEGGLACKDISDGWDAAAPGSNSDITSLTGISDGGTVGRTGSLLTFDSSNGDVTTSQQVGIGTSDPQSALHVSGPNADISLGTSDTNVTSLLSNGARAASRGALYFNHDGNQTHNHLYLGSAFELIDGVSGAAPTFQRAGSDSVDPSILKIGENGFQFLQGTEGVVGTAFTPTVSMAINRLGNIGIGTDTPTHDLHVHQDSGLTQIKIGTNGASAADYSALGFTVDNDGTPDSSIIGMVGNDGGLRLSAAGGISGLDSPDVTILNSGHVGIGTTNPSNKLTVAGGAIRIDQATAGISSGFKAYHPNGVADGSILMAVTDTDIGAIQVGDDLTQRNLALQPSGGNVGIGTIGPNHLLDVAGVSGFRNYSVWGSSGADRGFVTWGGGVANTFNITGAVGQNLSLGSNGAHDRATLLANGNFGIGSTSPLTTLDVNGNVRIGSDVTTCDATHLGSVKYDSTNKRFLGCSTFDGGTTFAFAPVMQQIDSNITINVDPPTGDGLDCEHIQDKFDELALSRISANALVTIQIPDGTYVCNSGLEFAHPDGSRVNVIGNTTTPSNVDIQVSNVNAFTVRGSSLGQLNGVRISGGGASTAFGIYALRNASIRLGNMVEVQDFDDPNSWCVVAMDNSTITVILPDVTNHLKLDNCEGGVLAQGASTFRGYYTAITNAQLHGFYANMVSHMEVGESSVFNVTTSGWGYSSYYGSNLVAPNSTASGGDMGFQATGSSYLEAPGSSTINVNSYPYLSHHGSSLHANGASADGDGTAICFYAAAGGFIWADLTSASDCTPHLPTVNTVGNGNAFINDP